MGPQVDDRDLGQLLGRDSGSHEVLAHRNDAGDGAGIDLGPEGPEACRGKGRCETCHQGSADVRVPVGSDQELVPLPHPGDQVHLGLHGGGELLRQKLLLDRAAAGPHDGDPAAREQVGGRLGRMVQVPLGPLHPDRLKPATFAYLLVEDAAAVGHPGVVDSVILAGGDPVNHALPRPDRRVHPRARLGVDAAGLLQEPDAHLEPEVGARERTDRADVDGVQRIVVLELLARVAGERAVAAAVDEPQDVVLGDLLAEANAARAQDAALIVKHDAGAEHGALRLYVLLLDVAGVAAAIAGGLLLELAFARLVADRAVERVVDQQELHHSLAALLDDRGGRADVETGRGVGRARDRGPRHPVDPLLTGRGIDDGGLGRRVHCGQAHLDQAHAAVADDRELRMVAVVRHVDPDAAGGLDHVRALGHGDLLAVDGDGDQVGSGGLYHRASLGGGMGLD